MPVILPDANGCFAVPADGAKFMASLGIPQIPLRGKRPFFNEWPTKGSTDFAQIDRWAAEFVGLQFRFRCQTIAGWPISPLKWTRWMYVRLIRRESRLRFHRLSHYSIGRRSWTSLVSICRRQFVFTEHRSRGCGRF